MLSVCVHSLLGEIITMRIKSFCVVSVLLFLPCFVNFNIQHSIDSCSTNDDCQKCLASIEAYKNKNHLYFYDKACVYHKMVLMNMLSDDLIDFFCKSLDAYCKVFGFNNNEYSCFAYNAIVSLYNEFLKRVNMCEEYNCIEYGELYKKCVLIIRRILH